MTKEAILIHGWDPEKYNRKINIVDEKVAWNRRPDFISLLQQQFELKYYNLPGFCGVPEPNAEYYNVENFTNEFARWMRDKEKNVEVIIGYSFGGAILLDYKARFKPSIPVVLISPAIKRLESTKSEIAHTARQFIPQPLIKYFKDMYQKTASKYYRDGTPFLRSTYDVIVRRDLSDLFKQVDQNGILLIYGTNDEATPWELVEDKVEQSNLPYHLIAGGTHNIGQTHSKEIVDSIVEFLNKQR